MLEIYVYKSSVVENSQMLSCKSQPYNLLKIFALILCT